MEKLRDLLLELFLIGLVVLNEELILAAESSASSSPGHVTCDQLLARPKSAILHISGRVDRRHLKLNRANKGRHGKVDQGPHQSPVVMVSTMADGEETSCQEIVDVDDNGMFQADVAVISNRGSWSAMVSSCETGSGNNNANSCRSMVMLSPGEHSGDGCHPVAARADQSRQDYPGKSYYVVKADFRRCDAEEHRSSNAKPRVVAVRRSRRQAGAYPGAKAGEVKRTRDGHNEAELDHAVVRDLGPPTGRQSYEPQAHHDAPMIRGNTQGKVPDVDAEGRMSSRGDDRRGHSWKEASEQDQTGADEEPAKRRWEKSGMAWMKKNDWNQREPSYEETGDELGNAKRRWEKSGMSWMRKREDAAKRRWEKSGMSWMKRSAADDDGDNDNNYYYNGYNDDGRYPDDPADTAIERRWGKSGFGWIKRPK